MYLGVNNYYLLKCKGFRIRFVKVIFKKARKACIVISNIVLNQC